jgi:hypothetical protein
MPPGIELAPLGPEPIPYPCRNRGGTLEVGAEVCRVALSGNSIPPVFDNAGHMSPHILLEERRPVVSTLEQFERFVEKSLKDFEQRLAGFPMSIKIFLLFVER